MPLEEIRNALQRIEEAIIGVDSQLRELKSAPVKRPRLRLIPGMLLSVVLVAAGFLTAAYVPPQHLDRVLRRQSARVGTDERSNDINDIRDLILALEKKLDAKEVSKPATVGTAPVIVTPTQPTVAAEPAVAPPAQPVSKPKYTSRSPTF